MSDNKPLEPVREPIVIHGAHTKAGKKVKDLDKCFFLSTDVEGFYNFYNPQGRTLATGVSTCQSFPFLLDKIAWRVYEFAIDPVHANGKWINHADDRSRLAEQDGTFQATSTGGGHPTEDGVEDAGAGEAASAASA